MSKTYRQIFQRPALLCCLAIIVFARNFLGIVQRVFTEMDCWLIEGTG